MAKYCDFLITNKIVSNISNNYDTTVQISLPPSNLKKNFGGNFLLVNFTLKYLSTNLCDT